MFAPAFGLVISVAVLSAEIEQVATDIDGDWELVSVCGDGHEEFDEKTATELGVLLQLEKGAARFSEHSKPSEPANPDAKDSQDTDEAAEIEYRLDPMAAPRQIDWFVRDDDEKTSRKFQGIYRLKDDELVVCFTVTEDYAGGEDLFGDGRPTYQMVQSPRPTTFERARQIIWTLKRAPAVKDSP